MRKLLISGFILTMCLTQGAYAIVIAGSTSGIFNSPVGPSGMVTTGVGTSNFTWGIGSPPSSLGFSGTTFSTTTETVFDVGSVTYFNGAINVGSEADSVDLAISLSFTTPAGINETLSYMLTLINTLNTSDPNASADIISFNTSPTSTFLLDGISHTLTLEVGTVTGSGFSSQSTFSVLENGSATAVLRGIVTSNVSGVVPEPATLALLGLGLFGLGFNRRKRIN